MGIHTHEFRGSFPALWGICCGLEWATSSSWWAQSECRLRSAGLCPHQSQLLVQAQLASIWSDGAANVTASEKPEVTLWDLGTDMADTPWLSEENPILPFLEKITCFAQLQYLHGSVSRAGYPGHSCNEKQEKVLWSTANILMQVSKLVIPLCQSVGSGEHLGLTEL